MFFKKKNPITNLKSSTQSNVFLLTNTSLETFKKKSILKYSLYQKNSLKFLLNTRSVYLRGLKSSPSWSGKCLQNPLARVHGQALLSLSPLSGKPRLTYFACLFSSSRFRVATYPSRYFWSSSNVPTVWLNVLNRMRQGSTSWRYQDNLTLSVPIYLCVSMCVCMEGRGIPVAA